MKFIRVNIARYNRKLSWRLRSVLISVLEVQHVMTFVTLACGTGLVIMRVV